MLAATLLVACQKEISFESGPQVPGGTSEGALGGSPGACANISFVGTYGANIAVADSNAMRLEVTFTKVGSYTIGTDTCNGLSFRGSGVVTAITGVPQTVVLKAFGTPTAAGSCTFLVSFKGSTCTASLPVLPVAAATTGDYFPTTVGSNWSYFSSSPGAQPDDSVYTLSINANATINSTVYRMFTSEDDTDKDTSFYRKTGNNYHQFGDLDVAGVASNFVNADYIFLRDDVPLGGSWETGTGDALINGVPLKMKLSFTIAEKDVDVVVNNRIFRNVIKVRATSLAGPAAGPFAVVTTYESWYAKGIGLINVVAPIPVFGFAVTRYVVN
ncbi:MAG: hypothetical protein EAY75_02745 [Bacteroidetes bacterium]|nr:MAG: hypothetical protein EAY75_02745 [Bacteroidota bacterium]